MEGVYWPPKARVCESRLHNRPQVVAKQRDTLIVLMLQQGVWRLKPKEGLKGNNCVRGVDGVH